MPKVPGPLFSLRAPGTLKKALTFATQLVKTESLRAESTFGDIMRGLMVYGRAVIQPSLMTEGVVVKG